MARKKQKGFYERVKTHVKEVGGEVWVTMIFPQDATSDLFSEIKHSIRRKRSRKQPVLKLVTNKPAA